jgi:hypothetical protein
MAVKLGCKEGTSICVSRIGSFVSFLFVSFLPNSKSKSEENGVKENKTHDLLLTCNCRIVQSSLKTLQYMSDNIARISNSKISL